MIRLGVLSGVKILEVDVALASERVVNSEGSERHQDIVVVVGSAEVETERPVCGPNIGVGVARLRQVTHTALSIFAS